MPGRGKPSAGRLPPDVVGDEAETVLNDKKISPYAVDSQKYPFSSTEGLDEATP